MVLMFLFPGKNIVLKLTPKLLGHCMKSYFIPFLRFCLFNPNFPILHLFPSARTFLVRRRRSSRWAPQNRDQSDRIRSEPSWVQVWNFHSLFLFQGEALTSPVKFTGTVPSFSLSLFLEVGHRGQGNGKEACFLFRSQTEAIPDVLVLTSTFCLRAFGWGTGQWTAHSWGKSCIQEA